MMTLRDMQEILRKIEYKDKWTIDAYWEHDGNVGAYLQVHIGDMGCRKWRLSTHMTVTEVVQTAFAAVKAAEEHEAREAFKYKGVEVFGPHLNVDDLAQLIINAGSPGKMRIRLDSRT